VYRARDAKLKREVDAHKRSVESPHRLCRLIWKLVLSQCSDESGDYAARSS
jgi:hypothetical protein